MNQEIKRVRANQIRENLKDEYLENEATYKNLGTSFEGFMAYRLDQMGLSHYKTDPDVKDLFPEEVNNPLIPPTVCSAQEPPDIYNDPSIM